VRYVVGADRRVALMVEDETPRSKRVTNVPLSSRRAREIRRVLPATVEGDGGAITAR
jgi:hypothetical protein